MASGQPRSVHFIAVRQMAPPVLCGFLGHVTWHLTENFNGSAIYDLQLKFYDDNIKTIP